MAKKYDIIKVKSEDITDETLTQKGEEGFAPWLTFNRRNVINNRLVNEEYVIFIRTRCSGGEAGASAGASPTSTPSIPSGDPTPKKNKGGRPPGSKNKPKKS